VAKYSKFIVALVPLVTTLVVHFAGADSDVTFVWAAVVSALTAAGVYVVPNK
jgi:hypothetical protein